MSEPIIISSDRYKRLREQGYIGEHGEFTDKASDAVNEYLTREINKLIEERRQSLELGPDTAKYLARLMWWGQHITNHDKAGELVVALRDALKREHGMDFEVAT